jgi:oligopeptide transport system substrate-binding protein
MNFLDLWTCESGNNNTNYCNEEYDNLVEQARQTEDNAERYEIYGQLEEILFGPDGEIPFAPIYYYTNTALVDEAIKDTFSINLLDQIDLTEVDEGDASGEEENA